MELVKNIRDIRKEHDLTQSRLAELSELTQVYLSTIENGKMPMTKEASVKLYKGFIKADVDLGYKSKEELRAAHMASFYKEEFRQLISSVLLKIYEGEAIVDYISENNSLPTEEQCPNVGEYINK
jgi:transcriptional regulator with XRE-family HTH domain